MIHELNAWIPHILYIAVLNLGIISYGFKPKKKFCPSGKISWPCFLILVPPLIMWTTHHSKSRYIMYRVSTINVSFTPCSIFTVLSADLLVQNLFYRSSCSIFQLHFTVHTNGSSDAYLFLPFPILFRSPNHWWRSLLSVLTTRITEPKIGGQSRNYTLFHCPRSVANEQY